MFDEKVIDVYVT